MMKKLGAIFAALILAVALFPQLYGGDSGFVGQIVKDPERYYHRLKNMRANDPDNPELSYQIANVYYSLRMEDEAIKEYRRTLKLAPEHQAAKWFLSKLLVSKGYFEDAFWLVRSLIVANINNAELYSTAGDILQKMGENSAAKEYYNKYDELKYGEADGSKPAKVESIPDRRRWKAFF